MRTIRVVWTILVLVLSLALLTTGFAAPLKASSGSPVIEWTTTYGAQAVVQTEDGGYLFAGSTLGLLVKADSLGNIEWNRTYEGISGADAIFKTDDGGYVTTGVLGQEAWLLKVDALGNILWNKTYEIEATCVVQTGDDGYIFVGNILLKIDAFGDIQWSKPIEGTWVAESEGGYIISSEEGGWGCTARLIGTDAEGIVEWNKSIVLIDPTSPTYGNLQSMIGTNDGGIVLTAWSYGGAGSQMGRIFKFDSSGDKEWTFTHKVSGGAIVQTADGGYARAGPKHYTDSAAFVKINQTGHFQWETLFGSDLTQPSAVIETIDGGFLVTGHHIYKFSPYPRHNIAISEVTVPSYRVKERHISPVNVTVQNNGNYDETTEVFLYDNSILIDSQNVTLSTRTSEILTFLWNTADVGLGQHNILANATPVAGETYLGDNTGQTIVLIMGGSKISISTVSSSVLVGFHVTIAGTLTDHKENVISGGMVFLYYRVQGAGTWNPVTSVSTETNGHYSAIWIPTATGYFTLQAKWNGNATHFGASNSTTLSVIPYNNEYIFAVESNSTISALAFNSTSNELSFSAGGPTRTTGYAKVFIAKELVANISDLKVYVDENQVDYVATSTDDSWVLYFLYVHSTHHVLIVIPEFPPVLILPLLMVFTFVAVMFSKKRRQNVEK